MEFKYYIDEKRFRVKPTERYIRVNGWCFERQEQDFAYESEVDGKLIECKVKKINRPDVQKKFGRKYKVPKDSGFHIKTYVGQGVNPESYRLYLRQGGTRTCIVSMKKKNIEAVKDESTISSHIDWVHVEPLKIIVSGWAVSASRTDEVHISIRSEEGETQDIKLQRVKRKDVEEAGLIETKNAECGFLAEFIRQPGKSYTLVIADGVKRKKITLDPVKIKRYNSLKKSKHLVLLFVKALNAGNVKKGLKYIKNNGIHGLKDHLIACISMQGKPYGQWFEENKVSEAELGKQKKTVFGWEPKFSIIVPTYKTPENFLREMIDSVRNQSYGNWELCIADGSGGDDTVEQILEQYAARDSRIKYTLLKENLGISGNTNASLKLATGDYVGLFDHDDVLTPDALFEMASALQECKYDILYTDEDKMSGDGQEFNDPNFKPDFSMDLFRSHNYITHFFVVKTDIIRRVGGFRPEFDGSQDYDLMFRCIEQAEHIKHIPKILYHWRIHMNSVAGDPSSKMYAYEAGKHAIEEHLMRAGLRGTVSHVGLWGMYHVNYAVIGEPLISVIIPNKDHAGDLKTCISSFQKSTYKNYEFVIVENNSTEKETFAYYEELERQYTNVKVVYWKEHFNYSSINNFGVTYATGEYLLFLNNDTELLTESGIEEMLGICMREDVGAVGAKLLFEDDTIQHAGIVIGFGNYAGHVHMGLKRDDYGYMVRARINCNYSAVTAACLMTKKSLFEKVGGFDEQFAVACNDVDLCLKFRQEDKLVVYNAFSEWHHYESKSRGYEDTPEKLKRFEGEVEKFQKKWPKILEEGDPFYNSNFAINQAPFTLG